MALFGNIFKGINKAVNKAGSVINKAVDPIFSRGESIAEKTAKKTFRTLNPTVKKVDRVLNEARNIVQNTPGFKQTANVFNAFNNVERNKGAFTFNVGDNLNPDKRSIPNTRLFPIGDPRREGRTTITELNKPTVRQAKPRVTALPTDFRFTGGSKRSGAGRITDDSGRQGFAFSKTDDDGDVSRKFTFSGLGGASGQMATPFRLNNSADSSSSPFGRLTFSGMQGNAGGGTSSHLGNLNTAGGLFGSSVPQGKTIEDEDTAIQKKEIGETLRSRPLGFNSLDLLGLQIQNPADNVQTPVVPETFDAGEMQTSRANNQPVLNTPQAQSRDDFREEIDRLTRQRDELRLRVDAENPLPDELVEETPEQIDFLSQFPQEEQFSVQQAMDEARRELGLTNLTKEREETKRDLLAIEEVFDQAIEDIRNNPDMPKGLAKRRMEELERVYGPQYKRLQGQLEIIEQSISDANTLLNQEFQVIQEEERQRRNRMQDSRSLLQTYIDTGAIANFSENDIQVIAQSTGIPFNALISMRNKAQSEGDELLSVDQAEKLGVPFGTSIKEAASLGIIPGGPDGDLTKEIIDLTSQLRSEPAYKEMFEVRAGYNTAKVGFEQNNGFGDIAMVNGYQRMIDPGATVRGEDIKTQAEAAGYLQQVLNLKGLVFNGDRMTSDVRARLNKAIEDQYQKRVDDFASTRNRYEKLINKSSVLKENGVSFDDIGQDFKNRDIDSVIDNVLQNYPNATNEEILEIIEELESEQSFNSVGSDTQQASIQIPKSSRLAFVNNNPGNLRFVGQQGATEGEGGFARFETAEEGYRALQRQIQLDAQRGLSLEQFISKYAPPSENNTELYIQQVQKMTGAGRNQPISRIPLDALSRAIALKESSTRVNV